MTAARHCPNNTPPWFTGHWRDWHRSHGCDKDDGRPRSEAALTEISQHEANKATGYLTDAELSHLRARTTSGDTLLIRALDELFAHRKEVAQRSAELTEALDIFDRARCTEHSPKPEQLARIEELRISATGSAKPERLSRIEELRKEAAASAKDTR